MKKKEFKTVKQRAKDIVERADLKMVDRFNWKMKEGLSNEQAIEALKTISHFITIPTSILSETEMDMFKEELFEQIKVS